ncbi:MAG: hypothetical protein ABIG60_03035 [Patescibacteria group bacterium]
MVTSVDEIEAGERLTDGDCPACGWGFTGHTKFYNAIVISSNLLVPTESEKNKMLTRAFEECQKRHDQVNHCRGQVMIRIHF